MPEVGTQTANFIDSMKGVNDWTLAAFAIFFGVTMVGILLVILWFFNKNAIAREIRLENRYDKEREDNAKENAAERAEAAKVLREISETNIRTANAIANIPELISKLGDKIDNKGDNIKDKLELLPDKITTNLINEIKNHRRSA
jgi:hypothetical protein